MSSRRAPGAHHRDEGATGAMGLSSRRALLGQALRLGAALPASGLAVNSLSAAPALWVVDEDAGRLTRMLPYL